jgi:hypothetical protein
MSRHALNITITEPMLRARVPERLDALAAHTELSFTRIAARALQLGLLQIEEDPRRLFPGVTQQPPSNQRAPDTQPDPAPCSDTQAHAGNTPDATQAAATPRRPRRERPPQQPAQLDAQPSSGPQAGAEADPAAMTTPTEAAARALGHPSPAAFREHVRRHPELERWSSRSGRGLVWNLGGLRSDYERLGFRVLGQRAAQEHPDRLGAAEPVPT